MTIYLDLVFILNFCYDFLLLMSVSVILKRNAKFYRLLVGAIIGGVSLFTLFINSSSILLFLVKILVSIIMCWVSFSFKNIKYMFTNLVYLYMCSVILAGFLYYLDLEFSYHHEGIIFYFNGLSVNYVLLLILAPLVLLAYVYQIKKLKHKQNFYYKVTVVFKNNAELILNGYIDSGNKLRDPVTLKYIIIVEKKLINARFIRSPMLVPYKSVNYNGFLKCFSPKYIKINNKVYDNYMLGIYDGTFNIENVDCILNSNILEDINV